MPQQARSTQERRPDGAPFANMDPRVQHATEPRVVTLAATTIVPPPRAVVSIRLRRISLRRDGRVAEGARLESVYTGNRIVGSNPTPSVPQKIRDNAFATLSRNDT